MNRWGRITGCYATSKIEGDNSVGGLVGYNNGDITNCYSNGDVTVTGKYVGGLVGAYYGGVIQNCYANGDVNGVKNVGGLIGRNSSTIYTAICTNFNIIFNDYIS